MKKILFISCFILTLFCNCSKDENIINDDINEENINITTNLPPTNFNIEVEQVKHNSALLKWNKSTDPENTTIKYSVFLENKLVQDNIYEFELKIEDLTEITIYNGYIIAEDEGKKTTKINFTFSTKKYYLTFTKEYGAINNGYVDIIPSLQEVLITNDEGYLFSGSLGGTFFTTKIDKKGDEIWFKQYDIERGNGFAEIKETFDNGYIIVGGYSLLKINENGDLQWDKILDCKQNNNCLIESVVQTADGGYLAVGVYSADSPQTTNIANLAYIIKLDIKGNILWEKKIGDSFSQEVKDILANDNGTYTLFGAKEKGTMTWESFVSGNGYWDNNFWVVKIDENGNVLNEYIYGDGRMDFPRKIIKTSNDNFVFIGNSWGAYNISESVIYKIDDKGNIIWKTYFQYGSEDVVNSVVEDKNGDLITIGNITDGAFGEMGLYKFNSNGNLTWEKQYIDFDTNTDGYDLKITNDNGFIIASHYEITSTIPYKSYARILKTDPEGNFDK